MTHTQELARYYKISCNANRYLKRFYTFVSDSGRVPALTNHDPIHIATMWDMRSPLQLQMTQQLTGGSSGKEWDPQKTVKRQSLRFGKVSLSATFEHRNTHTHTHFIQQLKVCSPRIWFQGFSIFFTRYLKMCHGMIPKQTNHETQKHVLCFATLPFWKVARRKMQPYNWGG